jgi:uncharacterized protein YkwD
LSRARAGRRALIALSIISVLGAHGSVRADTPAGGALVGARALRSQGCGAHAGIHNPLRASDALNAAALRWSRAAPLQAAIEQSGYRAEQSAALHVSGGAAVLQQALRSRLCAELTDGGFLDFGSIERGADTWIIIAAPFSPPAVADANAVDARLLQRINRARAQSRRCGDKLFPPAPPLQPSALLTRAAQAHAQDMISHHFFAHRGYDGSTPAQRVAATGYRYRIVGENIASGPETEAQAVAGWLASPAHCENIMDARFGESGVGYAASSSGTPQIFWVQDFAQP